MAQLGWDNFIHSDQSGWPAATDGQTWTQTGGGTRSIASNEGVLVSVGADTHVRLGTTTSGDAEMVCRVSINNANDVVGLQARFSVSGGNTTCYKLLFYSGGIHINKAVGGVNSNISNFTLAISSNTFYWMHFLVSGTQLFGKMWADGSAEPKFWQITATDSSVTGVGGVAVLGNTDAASTGVRFDNFYAVDDSNINQISTFSAEGSTAQSTPGQTAPIVYATDTFIRGNQAGWGAASDGQIWNVLTGPATAAISSNKGTITGSTTQTILTLGTNTSATDQEALIRLSNTANTDSVFIVLRASNSTNFYRCRLLSQALTIHKVVGGVATQLATASFTTIAGTSYWIRFRIVGTNLFAKVWADGSTEATSWLLATTDNALSSGGFGLGATLNSSSNTASFDSFYVIDYSEISQLLSFAADGSASGSVGITEQLSANTTTNMQASQTITEQLTSAYAEVSASGSQTVTEQIQSAYAEATASGTVTVTEALSLLDAISLTSEVTITEQRTTFSAEAEAITITVKYSKITFSGSTGKITFTAI